MPKLKYYTGSEWLEVDAKNADTFGGKTPAEFLANTLFTGNVGFATTSPNFTVDIAGDARVRSSNALRFGGTGSTDSKYKVQYNSTEDSLDFIYGQ